MFANTSVGIDVAKAHLDVYLFPQDKRLRLNNTPAGHAKLLTLVIPIVPDRIVLESTGGYETRLLHCLVDAGLPAVLVNPLDVRRFAQAARIMAKNDQIDARVLAEFPRRIETRVVDRGIKMRHVLKQLVTRRRQLVDQCVQLRNHLEHADVPMVIKSIQRSIKSAKKEIKTIEKLIQAQIDADGQLKAKQQKLLAAPGVGPTVSAVLVAELPELGTLHRSKLAALVGVAPFDNDSGEHRGKRSIHGGRATVRTALYLATLIAIRRDPHLKAHYQKLVARGKPRKVAIVACMNKRLSYLNSLVRHKPDTSAEEANEAGERGQSPQQNLPSVS